MQRSGNWEPQRRAPYLVAHMELLESLRTTLAELAGDLASLPHLLRSWIRPTQYPASTHPMESLHAKLSPRDKVLTVSRVVTLFGCILVALSSGTNYVGGLDTTQQKKH